MCKKIFSFPPKSELRQIQPIGGRFPDSTGEDEEKRGKTRGRLIIYVKECKMDLHSPEPRRLAPDMGLFFDELSRLGDGDLPNDWDAPYTGVCTVQSEEAPKRCQEPAPSDSPPRSCKGIRGGEPAVLHQGQGGCWTRLGGVWRLRPWEEAGEEDRPALCYRDAEGRRHKCSEDSASRSIREVPQRHGEASQVSQGATTAKEGDDGQHSLGASRCWEDVDGIRCLPRCLLCDSGEGSLGSLQW